MREIIEIAVGDFYVTKKGKKYECAETICDLDCDGCAFYSDSVRVKHCYKLACTEYDRKDRKDVIFIRRKDLEENNEILMKFKDSLVEACYNILRNTYLIEMATSKSEVANKVRPAANMMFEHYVKLKTMPESNSYQHWVGEIKGQFSGLSHITYSHNKKRPTVDQWYNHCLDNNPDFNSDDVAIEHNGLLHDEDYVTESKLKNIDHNQVSMDFHHMLRRCFGKIASNQKVQRSDIY